MFKSLTQSEENYLKAIYSLQERHSGAISTNDLAEVMETKASSVTDMIKRLSEKALISYKKYQGCSLTEEGRKTALKTIRKHRLWEVFLVEKLNFGWDEVHDIAEQLEHIRSTKLTDKLDSFLDYPKFDPHGDPIPNKDGEIQHRKNTCKLTELEVGKSAVVIGADDGTPSFLQYLDRHQIKIGSEIKLKEKFEFDGSATVAIDGKELNLSHNAMVKITLQILS
jgi:DtxR family Mn-dependent transcriptional regulator